ncbi:hypothetical protein LOTGIDRAFT_76888, partial [Lottia gigantea]
LTYVPENIPINTTTLDLSFNQITTIRNKDFQHLDNLVCLILSFNPISHIEEEAFLGLEKLQMLELNNHSLDYQVFDPDKLEQLDLSRNNLIKLPKDIFKSVNQLKIINLAFNKLFS